MNQPDPYRPMPKLPRTWTDYLTRAWVKVAALGAVVVLFCVNGQIALRRGYEQGVAAEVAREQTLPVPCNGRPFTCVTDLPDPNTCRAQVDALADMLREHPASSITIDKGATVTIDGNVTVRGVVVRGDGRLVVHGRLENLPGEAP